MKIIITGASGFIGRYLVRFFAEKNFTITALSRNPQKLQSLVPASTLCLPWQNLDPSPWLRQLNEPAVIINLIGENIAGHLWTRRYKQSLRQSRLDSVKTIVQALEQSRSKEHVLIQASAVGYYGNKLQEVDESSPPGNDFLARLVVDWEQASQQAENWTARRIITRFGVVLGAQGGALPKMLLPFKLFLGGPLGSGKQGFPWIHIADVAQAMLFFIEHEAINGVFNLVAPQMIAQKEFCKTLGKVLKRPCWLPVPAPLLKIFLGEMARLALLSGQFVKPGHLLKAGYRFKFPEIETTLKNILIQSSKV